VYFSFCLAKPMAWSLSFRFLIDFFLSEEHGSPSSSVLADVPELEIERVLDSSLLHRANGQAEFLVRSVADSEVLLFLGVWWHLE